MFKLYFNIGIQHIADVYSYDHILFLICLTAVYLIQQWKQILILITAFTLGHTTSLALATFKILHFSSEWIEFLIPVTIFITGLWNVVTLSNKVEVKTHWAKYVTAVFFGLIHGLGFSNYLQQLLQNEKDIFTSLLAFNIGIEVGQILIVFIILIVNIILLYGFKINRRDWVNIFSGAGMGVALTLIINRLPW
ncbi:MAG: HupE/UreJ family protein [Bacteroidales bacterium]|nr:HupE/UreJ family protein [Bacteroidales bacterium]